MSEARKELIRKAFKKCDTSGDGVLKVNDLKVSTISYFQAEVQKRSTAINFLGETATDS